MALTLMDSLLAGSLVDIIWVKGRFSFSQNKVYSYMGL